MEEVINNMDVVKPEENEVPEIPAVPSFNNFKTYDVVVTADALRLHAEPNKKSEVVKVVGKGTILSVISEKSGYLNVGDAWASRKYTKRK